MIEGVNGDAVSLHRALGHQFSFVEPAKPLVTMPADYSKEARIAELEGSLTFVAMLAADGSVSDLRQQ